MERTPSSGSPTVCFLSLSFVRDYGVSTFLKNSRKFILDYTGSLLISYYYSLLIYVYNPQYETQLVS
jgi:hypothetical protein